MKNLNLKLLLCCSTLLVVPQVVLAQTSVTPASCKKADCVAMGYSRDNVDYCSQYIRCPFDASYKICLHKCSDNYINTVKKVADLVGEKADIPAAQVLANLDASLTADLGFDSLDLTELTLAIEEGFGVTISDSDAAKIKTVNDIIIYLGATCEEYPLSSCPANANCASQYSILSCKSGYKINSAGTDCTSSSGSTTSCATGAYPYPTASMAKSNCNPYGYIKNSTTSCYKCCTINNASSCTNACTVTSCPAGGICSTSVSGTIVVTDCKSGYTAKTNSSTGCITRCLSSLVIDNQCKLPYFSNALNCTCDLGYTGVTVGTAKCYKCCTASDTGCLTCKRTAIN